MDTSAETHQALKTWFQKREHKAIFSLSHVKQDDTAIGKEVIVTWTPVSMIIYIIGIH